MEPILVAVTPLKPRTPVDSQESPAAGSQARERKWRGRKHPSAMRLRSEDSGRGQSFYSFLDDRGILRVALRFHLRGLSLGRFLLHVEDEIVGRVRAIQQPRGDGRTPRNVVRYEHRGEHDPVRHKVA